MLTIDDLPGEVLLEVFSYLLLPDRKHVRLVNKQWNELCNSARFTKYETLRFNNISDLDNTHLSRSFINLKLDQINITYAKLQLQFWKDHGCRIKCLRICNCIIDDLVLCAIIYYCRNIEHLSFSSVAFGKYFNDVKMSSKKLESLVKLVLTHSISDVFTVDMFSRIVPKLNHFAMSDSSDIGSIYILTDTLSLLEKQSQTLETLCFKGYSFVNDSFINSLCERVGVQLTGLSLPCCTNLTDNFLLAIAKKFVNLKWLDVSENTQLGLDMDPSLFSYLKNLKLVGMNSTSITDQVLSAVAALEQIEGLDVADCQLLTPEGISKAFGSKRHEKILDIRLDYVRSLTDEVLAQILPQLPNLKSIDLSGCNKFTPVGVSAITTNCKLLRILFLTHCFKINSISTPDMNGLKGLLSLSLSNCLLDPDTVAELKYLELQVISLLKVPVTIECLKSLLANCPSLKHVELSEDSVANLDLAGLVKTPADESGRKRPFFVTGKKFLPRSIFELSGSNFDGFPCSFDYDDEW